MMQNDRRNLPRRRFGYYMPVMDNRTNECIGHLSDISSRGFKLDSRKVVHINTDYSLRLDLTPDISQRSSIAFLAKAIWSQPDPLAPYEYVHGFEIASIPPDQYAIFQHIVEKYASK